MVDEILTRREQQRLWLRRKYARLRVLKLCIYCGTARSEKFRVCLRCRAYYADLNRAARQQAS